MRSLLRKALALRVFLPFSPFPSKKKKREGGYALIREGCSLVQDWKMRVWFANSLFPVLRIPTKIPVTAKVLALPID